MIFSSINACIVNANLEIMAYDKNDNLIENVIKLAPNETNNCCSNNVVNANVTLDNELSNNCNVLVVNTHTDNIETYSISNVIIIDRYGCLTRLLRITAWVIKLVGVWKQKWRRKNVSQRTRSSKAKEDEEIYLSLDAKCLQEAKRLWIMDAQQLIVTSPKFGQLRHQLDLFEDEFRLIRCGSRLNNAKIENECKHPCLLPKEHLFTKLAVLHAHYLVKHSNMRDTLNQLRSEFWISKCRPYVKVILSSCPRCKTFQSNPYN